MSRENEKKQKKQEQEKPAKVEKLPLWQTLDLGKFNEGQNALYTSVFGGSNQAVTPDATIFNNAVVGSEGAAAKSNALSGDAARVYTGLRDQAAGIGSGTLGNNTNITGDELKSLRSIGNSLGVIANADGTGFDSRTGRVTGGDDAFRNAAQAQLNALAYAQNQQAQQQSEMFQRRGGGGSSAAMNAQNTLNTQFSNQAANTMGQIGLQQLQRSDAARLQQAGVLGQSESMRQSQFSQSQAAEQARIAALQSGIGQQAQLAGAGLDYQGSFNQAAANQLSQAATLNQTYATGVNQGNAQNFDQQTAAVQNELAPAALQIGATAAENAGNVNTGGGGKK